MNKTSPIPAISAILSSAILGTGMTLLAFPQVSVAQPVLSSTSSFQPAAYRTVTQQTARETLSTVEIAPGRTTAIDFSRTNEAIAYVLLGDTSRVIYTANAELGSARAKTLFLRQIEQLRFPGATTAPITTLSVQTIDSTGQQYLYTFNLVLTNQTQHVGLMVVPDTPTTPTTPTNQLVVSHNRTASLNDVEEGLAIAIRRGYTSRQDPVVESVRQFLALARNGSTVSEATTQANISLSVVTTLAEIALDERLLRLLQPATHATESKVAEPTESNTSEKEPAAQNLDFNTTQVGTVAN